MRTSRRRSTGRIEGTIVDPQNAAVAGAESSAAIFATSLVHETKSNEEGIFRFPDLAIGTYEIAVSKQGFQKLLRENVELLTGRTLDLKLRLTVGA